MGQVNCRPLNINSQRLIEHFNSCFEKHIRKTWRARVVRGGDEPLYLPPANGNDVAEICYARNLRASIMHECSHWLSAGWARRQLVDYGYWYLPDGRDEEAQIRFEHAEAGIQALEAILCAAAQLPFRLSSDNLHLKRSNEVLASLVEEHIRRFQISGLPARARFWQEHLLASFGGTGLHEINNRDLLSLA